MICIGAVFAYTNLDQMATAVKKFPIKSTQEEGTPYRGSKHISPDNYSLLENGNPSEEQNVFTLTVPDTVTKEDVYLERDESNQCIYLFLPSECSILTKDAVFSWGNLIDQVYGYDGTETDVVLLATRNIYEPELSVDHGQITVTLTSLHERYDTVLVVDLPKKAKELIPTYQKKFAGIGAKENSLVILLDRTQREFSDREVLRFLKRCEADYYVSLCVGESELSEEGMYVFYQKYYYEEPNDSVRFADLCLRNLAGNTGSKAIGLLEASVDSTILNEAGIPAVSVYLGDDCEEMTAAKLNSEQYSLQLAKGLTTVLQELNDRMSGSKAPESTS